MSKSFEDILPLIADFEVHLPNIPQRFDNDLHSETPESRFTVIRGEQLKVHVVVRPNFSSAERNEIFKSVFNIIDLEQQDEEYEMMLRWKSLFSKLNMRIKLSQQITASKDTDVEMKKLTRNKQTTASPKNKKEKGSTSKVQEKSEQTDNHDNDTEAVIAYYIVRNKTVQKQSLNSTNCDSRFRLIDSNTSYGSSSSSSDTQTNTETTATTPESAKRSYESFSSISNQNAFLLYETEISADSLPINTTSGYIALSISLSSEYYQSAVIHGLDHINSFANYNTTNNEMIELNLLLSRRSASSTHLGAMIHLCNLYKPITIIDVIKVSYYSRLLRNVQNLISVTIENTHSQYAVEVSDVGLHLLSTRLKNFLSNPKALSSSPSFVAISQANGEVAAVAAAAGVVANEEPEPAITSIISMVSDLTPQSATNAPAMGFTSDVFQNRKIVSQFVENNFKACVDMGDTPVVLKPLERYSFVINVTALDSYFGNKDDQYDSDPNIVTPIIAQQMTPTAAAAAAAAAAGVTTPQSTLSSSIDVIDLSTLINANELEAIHNNAVVVPTAKPRNVYQNKFIKAEETNDDKSESESDIPESFVQFESNISVRYNVVGLTQEADFEFATTVDWLSTNRFGLFMRVECPQQIIEHQPFDVTIVLLNYNFNFAALTELRAQRQQHEQQKLLRKQMEEEEQQRQRAAAESKRRFLPKLGIELPRTPSFASRLRRSQKQGQQQHDDDSSDEFDFAEAAPSEADCECDIVLWVENSTRSPIICRDQQMAVGSIPYGKSVKVVLRFQAIREGLHSLGTVRLLDRNTNKQYEATSQPQVLVLQQQHLD